MTRQTFTPRADQVRSARHFAHAMAESLGCAPEDVDLVVSELATNACQHAETPFEVSVERHDTTLVIEVVDTGSGSVAECAMTPNAEHGRGVHIVAAIARSWGVRPQPPQGTLVWAELDCHQPSEPSSQGWGQR
jgi:anti-sigma regulatory factor (Ser/Thr protein kinase)